MTYVPAPLRRLVRERARERCEYCLVPDAVGFYPHEIDHVVAEKHLGQNQHPRCQCRGICADLRASAG